MDLRPGWRVVESSGQRLARNDRGQWIDHKGQLYLPLDAGEARSAQPPHDADEWFALGCRFEDAGHLAEAEHAYRQALAGAGPSAERCFNLANVLLARGDAARASERYRQAIEIEPDFADAWHNLGTALVELGETKEAIAHLQKVLELNPDRCDTHFNLADCLELLGRHAEAIPHWQAYLAHDCASDWGLYAARQLAAGKRWG